MERCNILIAGTLASGASALIDLLREYENVNVINDEFDDFRAPGLVGDQLNILSSIDYPDSIEQIIRMQSIKGRLIYKSRIWKLLNRLLPKALWVRQFKFYYIEHFKNYLLRLNQINLLENLHEKLRSDISYEEKIQNANTWINDVSSLFSYEKEFTLFDQPILPWSDIEIWPRVFEPFKMIYVYRNPRDQMAEIIKREILFQPFRSPFLNYTQVNVMSIYGKDRKAMLKFQKDALLNRMENLKDLKEKISDERLMLVDFDNLVCDYDKCKTSVENFIGLRSTSHKYAKDYFNPENARQRSISIYKDYLSEEELQDFDELERAYFYLKTCSDSNKIK